MGTRGRAGQVPNAGFSKTTAFGVKMTPAVKRTGCALMKQMIEGDQLIVEDYDLIFELSTFIRKGPSFEAEPGHNDDLCDCIVTFCWLTASQYFKNLTDVDLRRQMYKDKIDAYEEDMVPFGFVDDGISGDAPERIGGDWWFTAETV